MLVAGGCSGDESSGDESSGDAETRAADRAFCDAAAQLDTDVSALDQLVAAGDGSGELEAQAAKIRGDLEAMRGSGSEIASAQVEELDSAVSVLVSAVAGATDNTEGDNQPIIDSGVGRTVTATQGLMGEVANTCS